LGLLIPGRPPHDGLGRQRRGVGARSIIDHIFKIAADYHPVVIGVERDGLEEFIMQPLRHEQLRRGVLIPVTGYRAPKGKLSFIAALQRSSTRARLSK
jgi:hypothetical protein